MNFSWKKTVALVLIVSLIGIGFPSTPTHAQTGNSPGPVSKNSSVNPISCITSPATCLVYFTIYIISKVGSLFIAIAGFLLKIAINFSAEVTNSPAVNLGFQIMLGLANLGFVLALILIAVATIVRSQTYGVKKLLLKLVAAAILVNFSLVIVHTFINFADKLTIYFINQSICKQTTCNGIYDSYAKFSDRLVTALKPQSLQTPPDDPTITASIIAGNIIGPGGSALAGFYAFAKGLVTDTGGRLVQTILNMFFSATFLFIIALTLFATVIMFLIRYLYLGFLIIVMPMVWLLWIFPNFNSLWTKWWNEFVRWTLFGPAVIVFLYLAIFIVTNDTGHVNNIVTQEEKAQLSNNSEVGLFALTGQGTGFFEDVGSRIIVIGLAIGGLIFANSIGIHGASAAVGIAQDTGRLVASRTAGFAARKGKQYAGAAVTRKFGEKGKERSLSQRALDFANKPGRGRFGKFVFGNLGSLAARGATGIERAGGADIVGQFEKKHGDKNARQLQALLPGTRGAERVAAVKLLSKANALGDVDLSSVLSDKGKKEFERFGQGAAYTKDVEKKSLINSEMYKYRAPADQEKLEEAAAKFAEPFIKGEIDHALVNDLFSGEGKFGLDKETTERMAAAFLKGVAQNNQALIPALIQKTKGSTLKEFTKIYAGKKYEETGELGGVLKQITESNAEKGEALLRNFKNSILQHTLGAPAPTPTTPATPAAPTPPAAPAAPAAGANP